MMLVTGTHEWWLLERAEKIDSEGEKTEVKERERDRKKEKERERTGLTRVEEISVTSIFHVC